MAIVKALSKYATLADNHVRDYLLGIGQFADKYDGNRAQKISYIRISPDTPHMKTWDIRMDEDRNTYGTNISFRNKPVRTYNHYIFSPSPKDNVTADELDSALRDWCERVFQNKFDIVIVYHNDNSNKVQHAHMIINNVNHDLNDKHARVSSYVTPKCWEYASQLWQYMCKERGWYSFIDKQKADIENSINPEPENIIKETDNFTKDTQNLFAIDEDYFKRYKYYNPDINYKRPFHKVKTFRNEPINRPFSSSSSRNYTKGQILAKERGEHLWTDDIRNCIEIAYFQSSAIPEFLNRLKEMGINTEITKNKDFKYSHPENPEHKVTGKKLGSDYSRQHLIYMYEHQFDYNFRKGNPDYAFNSKIGKQIEDIVKVKFCVKISVASKQNLPKLEDISNMLRTCSRFYAWNSNDLEAAKFYAKTEEEYKALDNAAEVIEKLENTDINELKKLLPLVKKHVKKISNSPVHKSSNNKDDRPYWYTRNNVYEEEHHINKSPQSIESNRPHRSKER